MILKTMEFNYNITEDELINKLYLLTDNDYNGYNGEEYFIDGKSQLLYEYGELIKKRINYKR